MYPEDISLIASKEWENDHGYFNYTVQAYRGIPTQMGGSGAQLVDNEVGLGLFGSVERLKEFIDANPEIREAAAKLGGYIEPVNQQYGYGFCIAKTPEHEMNLEGFSL